MSALTSDRSIPARDGRQLPQPVAAGAVIHAGGLVALNTTGYAHGGAFAATDTVIGRAEQAMDNTGGADGAKSLNVGRHQVYRYDIATGDPVTQADVGKTVFALDDINIARTDGSNAGATPPVAASRPAAGKLVLVDADGAWVDIA